MEHAHASSKLIADGLYLSHRCSAAGAVVWCLSGKIAALTFVTAMHLKQDIGLSLLQPQWGHCQS